jgi:hypothetical protein
MLSQEAKKQVVIRVAGVYEVKGDAPTHVMRIMARTIIILVITTHRMSDELRIILVALS